MNEFEQRFQGLQPRWVGRGLLHPVGQHGHAFEEDKVLFENEAQAHDFARQFVRGVVTWEVTLHGMRAGSGSARSKPCGNGRSIRPACRAWPWTFDGGAASERITKESAQKTPPNATNLSANLKLLSKPTVKHDGAAPMHRYANQSKTAGEKRT